MTQLPVHAPDVRRPACATLALSAAERREVEALAGWLTTGQRIDDPAWLALARSRACELPVRLRASLRTFRHDPGYGGTLVVENLPVGESWLPPTPTVADSVEEVATTGAAVAALLGFELGELIAYRPEKRGAVVQNVVPVPGRESSQSNAGSDPLLMHVENAFHPNRPDFVGLLCLRADHEGTAGTRVASIRLAMTVMDPHDIEVLRQPRFRTDAPPSFAHGESLVHAVLVGAADDPNLCVDLNATTPVDAEAAAAVDALAVALDAVAQDVVLRPGQMGFLDNRIVVHGRTAFVPRYDGEDRWLHRVYVHLDNRRSRVHRRGGGVQLD